MTHSTDSDPQSNDGPLDDDLLDRALNAVGRDRASADTTPLVIGEYRIHRCLGEGGMGIVYEAEAESSGQRVALKVLKSIVGAPELRQRFRQEARILGSLNHPAIAQVVEVGFEDLPTGGSLPYIAMELVEDSRPMTVYAREKHLDRSEILTLFAAACDGVEHGHQCGVVHRDLKPANILVSSIGDPKVIDFGIARIVDENVTSISVHTRTGQILGTPQYMCPEQFTMTSSEVDVRCDVYSLGVILYELLAGRPLYDVEGLAPLEVLRKVMAAQHRRPVFLKSKLHRDLDRIIAKATATDPNARYASAAVLGLAVRKFLMDKPTDRERIRSWRIAVPVVVSISIIAIALDTSRPVDASADSNRLVDASADSNRLVDASGYFNQPADTDVDSEGPAPSIPRVGSSAVRSALEQGDVSLAKKILADTPQSQRAWEWSFLHALTDQSTVVLNRKIKVGALAFDADGMRLVSGDQSGALVIWDTSSWLPLHEMSAGGLPITACAFGPDGKSVIASLEDGSVVCLDCESGATIQTPSKLPDSVVLAQDPQVGVSATVQIGSGDQLSASAPKAGALSLRDAATDTKYEWETLEGNLHCLAFHPGGALLVGGGDDRVVRIWNWKTGAQTVALRGHEGPVLSLATSSDGRIASGSADGTIRIWNLDTGPSQISTPHKDVVALALSSKHSLAALGSYTSLDTNVRIFDVITGRLVTTLHGHSWSLSAVDFHPDGFLLASGAADKRVLIWDLRTGREVNEIVCGDQVRDVAWSPDGRLIATVELGVVRLWDAETCEQLTALATPRCFAVDFSLDGTTLFAAGASELIILDVESRLLHGRILSENAGEQRGLAVHPDGKRVATCGVDGVVRFWNLESRRVELEFQAHEGHALTLAFDASGSRLVTGGEDHNVRVWDLSEGQQVLELTELNDAVARVAFSADESILIGVGRTGPAQLWYGSTSSDRLDTIRAVRSAIPEGLRYLDELTESEPSFERIVARLHSEPSAALVRREAWFEMLRRSEEDRRGSGRSLALLRTLGRADASIKEVKQVVLEVCSHGGLEKRIYLKAAQLAQRCRNPEYEILARVRAGDSKQVPLAEPVTGKHSMFRNTTAALAWIEAGDTQSARRFLDHLSDRLKVSSKPIAGPLARICMEVRRRLKGK